jgi:hypothetical protein
MEDSMRFYATILVFSLTALSANAQDFQPRLKQLEDSILKDRADFAALKAKVAAMETALADLQAKAAAVSGSVSQAVPKTISTDYTASLQQCLSTNTPVVIGVGCTPPQGYWIQCQVPELPGVAGPAVLVGTPGTAQVNWVATLPATGSAWQVTLALFGNLRTVSAPAQPGVPGRCQCGCEKTGQCTCANCSVGCGFLPATTTAAKTPVPTVPGGSVIDGVYYPYMPPQYYSSQPIMYGGTFLGTGGGCANGSCGTSAGVGRVGLFGRLRGR